MTVKALFPSSEPALELDFANTKALDPRISFTRASTGTCVGADGLIKTAARGTARFDHNSATGESLGLLVEDARTNRMWPSENIVLNTGGGEAWTSDGTGILITNAIAVAPNNLVSAAKIYKPNAIAASYLRMGPASAPSTSDTISIYFKAAELTAVDIQFTSIGYAIINLSAGTTTAGSLQRLSNGWYRFSYTPTSAPGDVRIYPGGTFATGDGASGIYVWGGQIEVGSVPSSYIPTTTATATRAADVATVSNTNSRIFPTSSFTTINSPFGTAGGASTVNLVGPTIRRTSVYSGNLPQSQINALTGTSDFWRWRVIGPTFALPNFTTDGSVTVDWGDGVMETLTTGVHTFVGNKTYYDIGFRLNSGTFFRPFINQNATYRDRVIAVGPAPATMLVNGDNAFARCTALRAVDGNINFSGGTSLSDAWLYCAGLRSFPFINTSSITNFFGAWSNCSNLTAFPLIDTSAGTNFSYTWETCSSLTSFPLVNTGAGTNFTLTWSVCSGLTSFPLVNTAAGTNFTRTWQNCTSLTSFPLLNTAAGTIFVSTWSSCTGLTSFPLINIAAGTNFNGAWATCTGLTSFPLLNTAAATNFDATWNNCTGLTSFPLLTSSSVTNFTFAWQNCSSLTSFPSLNFNACVGLASDGAGTFTGFRSTWQNCTSLTTFPANRFDSTTCTRYLDAFTNCALTAASIENIIVSINTAGTSNGNLGLAGGTNAGASTWTANAITAYNTLISRGWTITRNA